MNSVAICDYGAGNTTSVAAAFSRLGATVSITDDASHAATADLVVLPGVGSARSAMEMLRGGQWDTMLAERLNAGRKVLGICLGFQIAFARSDEDGGVECLGFLPGRVERISQGRLPRIGWAKVDPWQKEFYFAHSYAAVTTVADATSDGITAAASHGRFVGVQFHPEKSGLAGEEFLRQCLTDV